MNHHHFDALTRALTGVPSRRQVLRGLGAAGIGLAWSRLPDPAAAKRKRKRKNKNKKRKKIKQPQPNAYGCLSVGQPCSGDNSACCSGICEGTPPKKGKKDTSRCVAHDIGTCNQEVPAFCEASTPPLQTRCGNSATCFCTRTTAGSAVCGETKKPSDCADCTKDADCQALGFPPGSACAPFFAGNCAGSCESGMFCMAPCGTPPPEE